MFIQIPLKFLGTSASHIHQLSSRSSEHMKRGREMEELPAAVAMEAEEQTPLPPPLKQDKAAGWVRPYSSSRRPPSPDAAWRAASLVT
mgnify:CR=1 FL=1